MQNSSSNEDYTQEDALQRGLDLDKQRRQSANSLQSVDWVGWTRSADLHITLDAPPQTGVLRHCTGQCNFGHESSAAVC